MELIAGLIEGIVALFVALIEAIVGFFVEGAAGLGAGEALGLLLVLLVELFWWSILLFIALIKWRKPRKIPRPVLWRPQKMKKSKNHNENT